MVPLRNYKKLKKLKFNDIVFMIGKKDGKILYSKAYKFKGLTKYEKCINFSVITSDELWIWNVSSFLKKEISRDTNGVVYFLAKATKKDEYILVADALTT